MRLPPGEGLSFLATDVHAAVFAQEQVVPNILIRDFSSAVLEVCLAKGCLPASIDPESFRPPFSTTWPTILSDDEVKRFEDDKSWRAIVSSVRTESMGMYGDFGRYVMEAKIHRFSNRLLTEDPPEPADRHAFQPEYERVTGRRRGKLEMWANIRSFLILKKDRSHFIHEANQKHFYGSGVSFPEIHDAWIGEYPWGRAHNELREYCEEPDARVGEVGVPYWITACDWNSGSTLIPSPRLCEVLGLEWAGTGGEFRAASDGERVVGHLGGDATDWGRPFLVRRDVLIEAVDAAGMDLVWCVVAERSCWCAETTTHIAGKELEISAIYWLEDDIIRGGFTQKIIQDLRRSV